MRCDWQLDRLDQVHVETGAPATYDVVTLPAAGDRDQTRAAVSVLAREPARKLGLDRPVIRRRRRLGRISASRRSSR